MIWSVALEGLHPQREPVGVGEQTDGDLRFQPAFLGEPGFAEPVPLVGLEVQRRHVVQHQGHLPAGPGLLKAPPGDLVRYVPAPDKPPAEPEAVTRFRVRFIVA